ncbi:AraC family transcriptional regulator, partial [Staphylococcus succinus]|uniref:cupin domain-containing protein n=1 Tax=Staphylococcus succinus TaxID=61015 RepID=UPI000D42A880
MSFTGDFNVKLDSISLPNENEYIAWHKISDGHFGNELHYHDHYEIFFSLSGNMLYTIEGRQYQLDVGSMLIIAPYEFHQLNEQMDGHAERIGLRFDRKLLASLSNSNCQLAECFNTQNNDFKSKLQFKESE